MRKETLLFHLKLIIKLFPVEKYKLNQLKIKYKTAEKGRNKGKKEEN
ncbi:MAG: hypothetical protein PHO02_00420 [Candidatus Nanoarchaeia archaeon]|nr:hypothetical protein [Candidatus Nanoarchaeia archaeon]